MASRRTDIKAAWALRASSLEMLARVPTWIVRSCAVGVTSRKHLNDWLICHVKLIIRNARAFRYSQCMLCSVLQVIIFLKHNAMLARYNLCCCRVSLCLMVCHKSVFCSEEPWFNSNLGALNSLGRPPRAKTGSPKRILFLHNFFGPRLGGPQELGALVHWTAWTPRFLRHCAWQRLLHASAADIHSPVWGMATKSIFFAFYIELKNLGWGGRSRPPRQKFSVTSVGVIFNQCPPPRHIEHWLNEV